MGTERDICTELAWHRAIVLAYLNTIYMYIVYVRVCVSMYMNVCMCAVRALRVGTRHAASSRRRLFCALQSCRAVFIARCGPVSPTVLRVAIFIARCNHVSPPVLRVAIIIARCTGRRASRCSTKSWTSPTRPTGCSVRGRRVLTHPYSEHHYSEYSRGFSRAVL
jgi:hypothetical protein